MICNALRFLSKKQLNTPAKELIEKMLKEIENKRFSWVENDPILIMSTLLDPRFKNSSFRG